MEFICKKCGVIYILRLGGIPEFTCNCGGNKFKIRIPWGEKKEDFEEKMELIQPKTKPIFVKGKIYYNESDRANTVIRLKRAIREEFLDHSRRNVAYQMEYYRTKEEFKDRMEKLMESNVLPFIMFLYEEKDKV